ncbi:flagellar motor protein MotB [Acidilutibacter cellobiosedens]|jgi:chemotaxis protein MotB|uniref:Flagellar motor protein MotB n=1 Tax=Acidilutibacter cellobiosedens TaxID=2507161 RepID=A0A410QC98_9FIRM|nr:flagellar motor protein MotB [Acidilutibacter cellobiosedens]QAT61615.1 flagellar motor protein MotB [Acidilutibacter cellobiosedens]
MRKKREADNVNTSSWLNTYADMITLLLCFFVAIYAFSNVDKAKFDTMVQSFRPGESSGNGSNVNIEDLGLDEDELERIRDILEEYTDEKGLSDEITMDLEERGLVIRFKDSVFFDSGKADIKPKSKNILHYLAEILKKSEFKSMQIKIEGHTDSDPIVHSNEYPTNWELSAIRATNVLRYLVEVENIEGNRISSSGYSYYRPIAPNDTKANKAKNRRVDIVILRESSQKNEPK